MWKIEEHLFQVEYLKQNKSKRVRVYLPKSYDSSDTCYPVVYFHDGASVFFGKTMFGTGSWEVLDTLVKMEEQTLTDGYIVVAIDNANEERADEFLPFLNSNTNGKYEAGSFGGKAECYAKFLVETLKPMIESKYRCLKECSSICGSSLGGLVTAYIISEYPDAFYKAGIFSLASWVYEKNEWWNYLEAKEPNRNMKYYIYVGGREGHIAEDSNLGQKYVDDTLQYYRYLVSKGVPVEQIELKLNVMNQHNETAWSCYVQPFLLFE